MSPRPEDVELWERLGKRDPAAIDQIRLRFVQLHGRLLAAKAKAARRLSLTAEDFEAWAADAVDRVTGMAQTQPLRESLHGVIRKTAQFTATHHVQGMLRETASAVDPTLLSGVASERHDLASMFGEELLRELVKCIGRLTAEQQRMLREHYFDGRRKREVVGTLAPSAATHRFRTIHDQLLECLRKKGFDQGDV